MFEWLEGLPGFDKHTFTRERLAAQKLGNRFARDDSFLETYRLFEDHIASGERALLGKVIRPSLMSTMGAPGSGKSFLLDELAEFNPADVEKFATVERRELFHESNVLALNVTFNSNTPFKEDSNMTAERNLCVRILFQYATFLFQFSCICRCRRISRVVDKCEVCVSLCLLPLKQVFPNSSCDGLS